MSTYLKFSENYTKLGNPEFTTTRLNLKGIKVKGLVLCSSPGRRFYAAVLSIEKTCTLDLGLEILQRDIHPHPCACGMDFLDHLLTFYPGAELRLTTPLYLITLKYLEEIKSE